MLLLNAGFETALALFRASRMAAEPVIFPTDTIYGIGAPISSVAANKKIYDIKARSMDKPLPLLVGSLDGLYPIVGKLRPDVEKWLSTLWPGRYTVIFKAASELDPFYSLNGTVAVRMVSLDWLAKAIDCLGEPITATSINRSGYPPLQGQGEIYTDYSKICKFMLAGTSGTQSSMIIDISGGEPKTIRDI